ncbi:MAG: CvpA family protein [Desulfurispora sp.]|uniref:CvpA family protein n=1 Tax=Desulfurispora sp. TaxID=3014275 RepID=UPI00404AF20A
MNWLDWLLLAILLWLAWRGWQTGLVGAVTRVTAVVLGLALARQYYHPAALYLDRRWHLAALLDGLWSRQTALPGAGAGTPALPGLPGGQALTGLFHDLLLPAFAGWPGAAPQLAQLKRALSVGLLELLCFLLIFWGVAYLVRLAGRAVTRLLGLALLGPVNRAGGMLLGLGTGLLLDLLLLAVLLHAHPAVAFLSSTGSRPDWLGAALQHSLLVKALGQLL